MESDWLDKLLKVGGSKWDYQSELMFGRSLLFVYFYLYLSLCVYQALAVIVQLDRIGATGGGDLYCIS